MKTKWVKNKLYVDWTHEVETNSIFARNINKLNPAKIMNKLEISVSDAKLLRQQAFLRLLRDEMEEKNG